MPTHTIEKDQIFYTAYCNRIWIPSLNKDKGTKIRSAGGLNIKALTWTVRDVGLSPAWCYPFPCLYIHSKDV